MTSRPLLQIILCLLTGLLTACTEEINPWSGSYEKRITVNAIFTPDSIPGIHLSESMKPSGIIDFIFIENALAELTDLHNGSTFLPDYKNKGWYVFQESMITAGTQYSLVVQLDLYPDASGLTVVPAKPEFSIIEYQDGNIHILMQEKPDHEPYYMIGVMGWQLEYPDSLPVAGPVPYDTVYGPIIIESDQDIIDAYLYREIGHVVNISGLSFDDEFWDTDPDYTGNFFLISDRQFAAGSREISFSFETGGLAAYDSILQLDVYIYSLDFNYYQYLLTLARYWTTDEVPFVERASVHCNVEGGYGIIGSCNAIKKSIFVAID
ncbi:hypothetical protein ES708_06167 [subsurface metagenome]